MKTIIQKFSFVALMFAMCLSVQAQSVIFPQEKQPGTANVSVEGSTYTLSNDLFAANFVLADGKLTFGGCEELGLISGSEIFKVQLADGTEIPATEFTLVGSVATESLIGDPAAVKGSKRFDGKQIVANFSHSSGLAVEWRAVLRNGSHYLRTELDITNEGTEAVSMYSITPMIYTVQNVEGEKAPAVVGNTRGAVIVSDKIFAGLETPMGLNSAGETTDLETFPFKSWSGTASWAWTPDDSDIPEGVKNLSQYAAGTIVGARGYVIFREAGECTINLDYTSGNNRLQIMGVDILDLNGDIVDYDYHFGYTGGSDSNREYTVEIPSADAYMVRYFISINNEALTSTGTITYSKKVALPELVYDLASTDTPYYTSTGTQESAASLSNMMRTTALTTTATIDASNATVTDTWTSAWSDFADWTGTTPAGTTVAGTAKHKDVAYTIGQGKLSILFDYTGGNHGLYVLGVQVMDADGNVVSQEFKNGFTGSSSTVTYNVLVPDAGDYTVRYICDYRSGGTDTNGDITVSFTAVNSINAENTPVADTWTSAWTGFANWSGELPEGTTATGTAKYKDVTYKIGVGELNFLFDYTGGSHGLYVLGVQVIDLDGNVVAQEFKNGFTGSSSTVTYSVVVPEEGFYDIRYIFDYIPNSGTITNGDITISFTAIENIDASTTQQLTWTSNLPEFTDYTGTLPDGVTAQGTAKYMDKRYAIAAGDLTVLYDYTSGDHGLYLLGVQVIDLDGEIVATACHEGFTGGTDTNNSYSLDILSTGIYTVRFLVDRRNDGYLTNGNIDLSLAEAIVLGTIDEDETISQSWAPENWLTIAADEVPNRVNEVGCTDENARVIEQIITIESAGTLSVNFDYTSGSNKLILAGVDLIDATGNVVVDDYHAGETGNIDSNNTYTLNVYSPGIYKIRYFANNTENINSTGNITLSLKVDYTLHLIAPATTPMQGVWRRQTTLDAGEEWNVSAVVGVVAPGQARRSFLAYSERERAVPWRAAPAYISWYELNIDRNNAAPGSESDNMTEEDCLPVLTAWKEQLYDVYGVAPYAFVWDDGWDTYGEWQFHSGFPNGFTKMDSIGREMNAGQGAWLGPVGGYGTSGGYRRSYWNSTKTGGMQLSNPLYYDVFVTATTNLLHNYGYDFRFFKFDGISSQFSSVGPDAGATGEENAEAIIMAERIIRGIKEDTFINTTVGTWASPFWFQFTDAVWRQEKDYGEIGNNSNDRENWITYRDRLVYQNFVQNSPICPINTLMTHGFIFTNYSEPASTSRDWYAVVRELRCAFACGSGMVELYNDFELTNNLENPETGNTGELWGEIAKCMAWQKENADVLPDIHWVGGNPWTGSKAEIYGWAAWNAQKAVLTLRNGANDAQSITLTLREALDIPDYVSTTVTLNHVFDDQLNVSGFSGLDVNTPIDIDTELTITLPGSSLFVFDGTDDSFSGVETGKFYRLKDSEGNYLTSTAEGETLAMSATADNTSIFWLNAESELLSFSAAQYLNTFDGGNGGLEEVGHSGNAVEFTKGTTDGTVKIAVAEGSYLYSNATTATAGATGTDWVAEEVEALSVTIGAVGYSTLYSPVALEIPGDVTAYVATYDGEYVNLSALQFGVIPAHTAVILEAEEGTYTFAVTGDVEFSGDNVLLGTMEKIPASDVDSPYTLQTEASAASGVIMRRYSGTYINGFKMYMSIPDESQMKLSFRFPGSTTGVENVAAEGATDTVVYDLFGRKIDTPTKGLYIINGKKVMIK